MRSGLHVSIIVYTHIGICCILGYSQQVLTMGELTKILLADKDKVRLANYPALINNSSMLVNNATLIEHFLKY